MEIVNFYLSTLQFVDFFNKCYCVYNFWSTLHQDENAIGKNWLAGQAHNNGEEKGAEWVSIFRPWMLFDGPYINDYRCDTYTNTQKHITQSMQICCLNINIFLLFSCSSSLWLIHFFVIMSVLLFSSLFLYLFWWTMIVSVTVSMITMIMIVIMSWTLMKNLHHSNIEE